MLHECASTTGMYDRVETLPGMGALLSQPAGTVVGSSAEGQVCDEIADRVNTN